MLGRTGCHQVQMEGDRYQVPNEIPPVLGQEDRDAQHVLQEGRGLQFGQRKIGTKKAAQNQAGETGQIPPHQRNLNVDYKIISHCTITNFLFIKMT